MVEENRIHLQKKKGDAEKKSLVGDIRLSVCCLAFHFHVP